MLRVVLPQLLPRLLSGLRLSLGPAWLFLIAAEAIASTEGLGYRIFLVRRFLAMDVILPYVAWITLLAFVMDRLLDLASRRLFPWAASRMSAVVVKSVWKAFGDAQRAGADLARWSTSGSFVTMVGASGCGKTTFLRMLLGVETPTRGSITVDGAPLPTEPGRDRGIVFQRYSVFPHLTVLGNVVLGLEFAQSPGSAGCSGGRRRAGARRRRGHAARGRPGPRARCLAGGALGRHAAAAGDRPGADPQAARSCCSTSRSARSTPASATTCTS